jgi:hypothetical protein
VAGIADPGYNYLKPETGSERMTGETDLKKLIAEMHPALGETPYVFCTVESKRVSQLPFTPLGAFREAEGVTLIATEPQARDAKLQFDSTWACITLTVHSSLLAVGFLAAVLAALAQAGISVNPISSYYHDHLFVPWESRRKAMDVLEAVGR